MPAPTTPGAPFFAGFRTSWPDRTHGDNASTLEEAREAAAIRGWRVDEIDEEGNALVVLSPHDEMTLELDGALELDLPISRGRRVAVALYLD